MSVVSELEFANKFQSLINFVCPERTTREIKYTNCGFGHINTPVFYRGGERSIVSLTIKSLRAPKFEHEFKFDSTTSIYKVKEELAKTIGSSPDHLTLMLKTKTVHDEDLLEKYATEGSLKLNAIVKAKPESTETTHQAPQATYGLSPEAWAKISQILESEIVDETARNQYLQKLKRVRI
ncbi:hypothetical protein HPODL_04414 [Ogataea parapolymorpha DL-1]|uniref:Ubiquitin-like domain-containing protein n=1 Tax=Ogataea parapolymorpha (strain ATCC 26012 / BCRC 20466 / JCM 22074 / NRRL Y-7560 / DL-1) TaxID=871575 RepID=W1QE18_OGAPD|nr:hypothetical protein HPODL_04414 [Ogataea parapolymorpha DL-1]ESW98805.1 hypothetical protein HPODL_04414 [Ogataea parapolymorpha DL-1]